MKRNGTIIWKKCFRKIKKNNETKNKWDTDREKCIFIEIKILYGIEIKRLKGEKEKKERFEVIYKFSKRDVETEKYI